MTLDDSGPRSAPVGELRALAVGAGIVASILFVIIGVSYELQAYGDGSIFSYAVAVRDAWAFHWHNISIRSTVYLLTMLPAEVYVGLTGDPGGGVVVYGLLFFIAQVCGLAATFAADRSQGRVFFAYACFSTACFCPLVFGFPTEMWLAHAIFWPTLAMAHYARRTAGGAASVFLLLLALIFTHEGAIGLALVIVASLALRGWRDPALARGAASLLVAIAIWVAVNHLLAPDAYFAAVRVRAALEFFDVSIFDGDLMRLLAAVLAGYGIVFALVVRLIPMKAHILAASIIAVALAVYWLRWDHALHADNRYYLRTILLLSTCALGAGASVYALLADGQLNPPIPVPARLMDALVGRTATRAIVGAFALVLLVHAVETAKFVAEWTKYQAAVRALAMGAAADPDLGDPSFVSSARIAADLNRLAWFSTTPYLSALLTNFAPNRLVIDPVGNYFWMSCATASASAREGLPATARSRELVRVYSCLHR